MTDVIVFTNENGGLTVCHPTGEVPIEQVQAKDIPAGVDSYIIDSDSLPNADDDYFDAWEHTQGVVTVNFNKAKEMTKERLRREREPLLLAQDVAFQRAIESGADITATVAEKQRLRDLPALADTCTSLDQLRALKAVQ